MEDSNDDNVDRPFAGIVRDVLSEVGVNRRLQGEDDLQLVRVNEKCWRTASSDMAPHMDTASAEVCPRKCCCRIT